MTAPASTSSARMGNWKAKRTLQRKFNQDLRRQPRRILSKGCDSPRPFFISAKKLGIRSRSSVHSHLGAGSRVVFAQGERQQEHQSRRTCQDEVRINVGQ